MTFSYIKRLFKEPEKSYFLFGPRGTGKSTMAEERYPDALFIDLRIPEVRILYLTKPSYLLELVRPQPLGKTIIIDEIQKVPELLSLVHKLIEEKKQWKFILTGSSARKLKRAGVDLLGGRALKKVLHPFIAYELQEKFNLEDALLYGMLPLRFGDPSPKKTLKAYISLYIEEEVIAEGLARNIEPFARFLSVMSFSHGSPLNVSNVARECHVKRNTVDSWISILEDLLLGYQIHIFEDRAKRELSAHPKFYFFDAGVYRAIRPQSAHDSNSQLDGMTLEGLVCQHLVAWRDYTDSEHKVYYWQTRSKVEVDFVVYGELGLWAIEVKNAQRVHSVDLRSLKTFKEDYPEAQLLMVYRGQDRLLIDDILCIPVEEFLKNLCPDKPLF